MIQRTVALMLLPLALCVASVSPSPYAWAQEGGFDQNEALPPVRIVHQPPPAERLPFPGQNLTLEVSLEGTRAFTDPLRILASVDGKLIDTRADKSTLTEYDVPKYQIQIHSPMAQLSYQFLLYRKDGSVAVSDRYTVQRSCIPSLKLAEVTENSDQRGDERVATLEVQAKALERDGQSYRRSLKLLADLQQHLKEQGQ